LGQVTALLGKRGQPVKKFAIRPDQQHAGKHDGREGCDEKRICLSFNSAINVVYSLCGLLLALIVLYQQASYGDAQRRFASLKRLTYLQASLLFLAVARQIEDVIESFPELCDRTFKVLMLLSSARCDGNRLLPLHSVFEIGTQPLELSLEGFYGIVLCVVEHIAHSQSDTVQRVLNS